MHLTPSVKGCHFCKAADVNRGVVLARRASTYAGLNGTTARYVYKVFKILARVSSGDYL